MEKEELSWSGVIEHWELGALNTPTTMYLVNCVAVCLGMRGTSTIGPSDISHKALAGYILRLSEKLYATLLLASV